MYKSTRYSSFTTRFNKYGKGKYNKISSRYLLANAYRSVLSRKKK